MSQANTRRQFLGLCGAAALASLPLSRAAAAAPLKIDAKDPAAKALGYVDDVAAIKAGSEAAFKPGNLCLNCVLYAKSQEKGGYAPCAVFPGKLVAARGWCRAYAPA